MQLQSCRDCHVVAQRRVWMSSSRRGRPIFGRFISAGAVFVVPHMRVVFQRCLLRERVQLRRHDEQHSERGMGACVRHRVKHSLLYSNS